MDVALFERCIRYLTRKHEVVRFEDIAQDPEKLHKKANYATIMFDDGYKDNIQYALPILEKYQVKASFYVVTDCIDKNIPTWTYILDYSFRNTQATELSFPYGFLPPTLRNFSLSQPEDRLRAASKLKPFIKTLSHSDRSQVLNTLQDNFSDIIIPPLMMNWEDLRYLKARGHYIGSHTATHSMLGTIDLPSEVEYELSYSAERIKLELGHFPITISYPVGSYTHMTKEQSQKAGYKIGLAVKQNVFDPQREDLYEVSRIELYNESWMKTRLRMSNNLEKIKRLIRYK